MQPQINDIITFLKQTVVCNEFSFLELETVARHCTFIRQPAGSCLFKEGNFPDAFYFVYSGIVKITKSEGSEHEIIISLLCDGDCFGELAIIEGSDRNADAFILQDAELLRIDRDSFLSLSKENSRLIYNLFKKTLVSLREANQLTRCLSLYSSEKTIMNVLLRLAEKCGERKNGTITIPSVLSHQQMANMAGTSRKNFTLTLKVLEEKNIIKRSGESREKKEICIVENAAHSFYRNL